MKLKIFTPLTLLFLSLGFQVKAQLNIELLGHLEYADQLSNITGWANGAGKEFAIVGTYDGTSIVDVTDPTDPNEVQFVDGNNSIWREVRTWSNYAYVVTEAGGGLLCIDLSGLPFTIDFNYTDCGVGLETGHTVMADENGVVHVFGSNLGNGGDHMFDATGDPMNPTYLGEVDDWYIHDAFVRGDTLWAGNIYEGQFSVWDITDKTSPELMATQTTPFEFTHNVWLSDDNKYLFSTDEVTNAPVASFNVSDLTDIQELGQFRANPGTNSIPHNTMVVGDFLVTAYYRDGVVITDVHYPDNMIKTGFYDTSPLSGDGFNGCWGSWPYLPSGNIVAADMEEGLFVLGPTYVAACYLEGLVTDIETGAPIFGAEVSFTAVGVVDANTDISGNYHTGIFEPGLYDITFTKIGYAELTIPSVSLESGVITIVNAELDPLATFTISGQIIDAVSGLGIANADVLFKNATYTFQTVTDGLGNYTLTSVYEDNYTFYAGHWGHITNAMDLDVLPGGVYSIMLDRGIYDDFIFQNDWTVSGTSDAGVWEKDEPFGTDSGPFLSNPELDETGDFGDEAYITGNSEFGGAGEDDVDNGTAVLTSPEMDLSTYLNPKLTYSRWFYNGGGAGTPNDTLRVFINNGIDDVLVDAINGTSTEMSEWVTVEIQMADYIDITSDMTVRFRTADQSATGHLVEAGVDLFFIVDDVTSAPTAEFSSDVVSGCAPLTVVFDDNSASASSWSWTFDGGTPASSTEQNPTVLYSTPGTYAVTLVATNILGSDESEVANYVTVELCNAIEDEIISDLISVFPNPFINAATISVNGISGADMLTITDITGRIIESLVITTDNFNHNFGENLPAGVYHVNLLKQQNIIGSLELIKAE